MMTLQIKGTIIPNDDKWIYNLLDMDSTAPSDIVLPDNNEPLDVEINSGGGDVFSGSEIYTALRDYKGDVNIKVVGIAASAASVIAMAGNKVSISPTAQMMIHNVASIAAGDHNTLAHESNVLKNYNSSIASAYVDKTGKDMDELLNLMNEETWFTADEAVKQGFADEVMFSNEKAPRMVASASPVIPQDVIERMTSAMRPQLDLNTLADEVVKKIKAEDEETEEDKQLKCPECGHVGDESEFDSDEEGQYECPECGYIGEQSEFEETGESEEQENNQNKEPKAQNSGFMRFFF